MSVRSGYALDEPAHTKGNESSFESTQQTPGLAAVLSLVRSSVIAGALAWEAVESGCSLSLQCGLSPS